MGVLVRNLQDISVELAHSGFAASGDGRNSCMATVPIIWCDAPVYLSAGHTGAETNVLENEYRAWCSTATAHWT